jgi:hypothetical protein
MTRFRRAKSISVTPSTRVGGFAELANVCPELARDFVLTCELTRATRERGMERAPVPFSVSCYFGSPREKSAAIAHGATYACANVCEVGGVV